MDDERDRQDFGNAWVISSKYVLRFTILKVVTRASYDRILYVPSFFLISLHRQNIHSKYIKPERHRRIRTESTQKLFDTIVVEITLSKHILYTTSV